MLNNEEQSEIYKEESIDASMEGSIAIKPTLNSTIECTSEWVDETEEGKKIRRSVFWKSESAAATIIDERGKTKNIGGGCALVPDDVSSICSFLSKSVGVSNEAKEKDVDSKVVDSRINEVGGSLSSRIFDTKADWTCPGSPPGFITTYITSYRILKAKTKEEKEHELLINGRVIDIEAGKDLGPWLQYFKDPEDELRYIVGPLVRIIQENVKGRHRYKIS